MAASESSAAARRSSISRQRRGGVTLGGHVGRGLLDGGLLGGELLLRGGQVVVRLVLLAHDHVVEVQLAGHVGRRLRLQQGAEGQQLGVAALVDLADRVRDLTALGVRRAGTGRELLLGRDQLGLGLRQLDLEQALGGLGLLELGLHLTQAAPSPDELVAGGVEVDRSGAGSGAGVFEVVVRGLDLTQHVTLLVAEVLLVIGLGRRDRDDPGQHHGGDGCDAQLTWGAGEEAHQSALTVFGEVNAPTVTAAGQTLRYLPVSRSVGTSVSTGARIAMAARAER